MGGKRRGRSTGRRLSMNKGLALVQTRQGQADYIWHTTGTESVFSHLCRLEGIPELLWFQQVTEMSGGFPRIATGPCLCLAQQRLEFGECLSAGIDIGRVARQEQYLCGLAPV